MGEVVTGATRGLTRPLWRRSRRPAAREPDLLPHPPALRRHLPEACRLAGCVRSASCCPSPAGLLPSAQSCRARRSRPY